MGVGMSHTQRHSPVPNQRQPTIHKAHHRRPRGAAQHSRPVIHAAGDGEHGADLGQARGDAQRDERDEDPAVEHGDGLAVGQRDVHGRAEAEGHRHDGEAEAQDGHHAQVSRQLAFVAEAGERLVGLVGGGLAAGVHFRFGE
jgi:hypothetical protein